MITPEPYKWPVGTILKDGRKPGYWKVISQTTSVWSKGLSYNCRKCSPRGKEFQAYNGFSTDMANGWQSVSQAPVGIKASREGIRTGLNKRRRTHVIALISALNKELAELNATLGQ
jgi:hypothetical protein